MARMPFRDHRITCREGRSRISAACSVGEWKVTSAENGHWAARNEHAAEVRFRQRLAVRVRRIDYGFHSRPFANDLCEHTKLTARATALAGETRPRQTGFKFPALQQVIAQRFDLRGNRFQ